MAVTLDNATNMEAAYQFLRDDDDFSQLIHVPCSAHCLNLICQAGFDELKSEVDKIQKATKTINSPKEFQVGCN